MKSDLSKVKLGDKIWTIQEDWTEVIGIEDGETYPIKTTITSYTLDGERVKGDKHPSAFSEYPFKEQPIEKDTLVWFKDHEYENWSVGYYSRFENGNHWCFLSSKKSTETGLSNSWNIVTTENPLI
jgi:hypothetical protein